MSTACKGIIFDIKEFAIYDGPGTRQTVFFKGCPLRCSWCHNPEGQKAFAEILVNNKTGIRKTCGEVLTVEELVRLIRENSSYYAAYQGGVTFSGGEPLAQPEFLTATLSMLPDIHKAIETCGFSGAETFRSVVSMADYIMMDIKLVDRRLHMKYTGMDNRYILKNLYYLCGSHKPFVIRIPVIPGVNDNEANFRETARLIKGAKMLQRVELLPFHKTSGSKYQIYDFKYEPMFDVDQPVHIPQEIFSEYGIRSVIL